MAYYCIVFYYTDTIDLNNLKGRDNVKILQKLDLIQLYN